MTLLRQTAVPLNEETILLDLHVVYHGQVEFIAFNKWQEAKTGADWLGSFASADGNQSMIILIQAKRLDDAERICLRINHYIGKRKPPVRRLDQLLATATAQGVPALYAFYNHLSQDEPYNANVRITAA